MCIRDRYSPNKNIVPVTTTIESNEKLHIGGCSIEDLVRKYDSPLISWMRSL